MNGPQRASFNILFPLVLVVTVLYVARDFFIPIALAILISFLLAPLIKKIERLKIGRIASVLLVTLFAFSVIGGLGYIVGVQVIDLAEKLPNYKSNLRAKMAVVRGSKDSALSKATTTLEEVTKEIDEEEAKPDPNADPTPSPLVNSADADRDLDADTEEKKKVEPVTVQVVDQTGSAVETLKGYLGPVVAPLGVAAIVIVFVIFILLQLEDLRDRVIHLIGRGHLRITTQAIDEAGKRVSRYLLAQLIVNVTYGIPVGVGLYFIGIPNAVLWGLLATVLRFIPYIGPWLAASFPIFLSLAVSPGWTLPLLTIGLFLILEIISNNVVEPWLYGSSTGLSPVAIIASAAFWTWLWGPIGLLLATPLTVCLAVLGKYIPELSFIDVLLGDRPPIALSDRFYQRLLALDEEEICELADSYLEAHSLGETFEELIIPALRLAETDFRAGILSEDNRAQMHQIMDGVIKDLGEEETPKLRENATDQEVAVDVPTEQKEPDIFLLPACNHADELAALMLARMLAQQGVAARVCASKLLTNEMVQQVTATSTRLLCVSVLPPSSVLPASLVCRRLRQALPDARITVGLWEEAALNDRRRKRFEQSHADMVYTSLLVATRELESQAGKSLPTVPAEATVEQT